MGEGRKGEWVREGRGRMLGEGVERRWGGGVGEGRKGLGIRVGEVEKSEDRGGEGCGVEASYPYNHVDCYSFACRFGYTIHSTP